MVQKLHPYEPSVNLVQVSLGFIIWGYKRVFINSNYSTLMSLFFSFALHGTIASHKISPHLGIFSVSKVVLPEFTTNQSPYQLQLRSHLTGLTITAQSCISQGIPNLKHTDQKWPYVPITTHCAGTAMCPAPTFRNGPLLNLVFSHTNSSFSFTQSTLLQGAQI